MKNIFQDLKRKDHKRYLGGLDVFRYIGPGLLVTGGSDTHVETETHKIGRPLFYPSEKLLAALGV